MLSLLRARFAQPATRLLCVSTPLRFPVGTTRPALQYQRSIVSSAALSFPAAGKTASKSKSASKSQTTKRATKKPAKKVAAKKKSTTAKARKPKTAVKPKVTGTDRAKLKPPPKPASGYLIFMTKFMRARENAPKTLEDNQISLQNAARTWNSLSPIEKQPFLDESAASKARYPADVAAWSQRVRDNMQVFNQINRERAKKGKYLIHLPKGQRRPSNSYLRFFQELYPTLNGNLIERSREAGKRWRALGDKEKERYVTEAKKDVTKWKEGL